MKIAKTVFSTFNALIVASSLAISMPSAAYYQKQVDTTHVSQPNGRYCGPSSMSQLSYSWKETKWIGNTSYFYRYNKSISTFVDDINKNQRGSLNESRGETSWYDGGYGVSDWRSYPAAKVLNKYSYQHHHTYKPFGPATGNGTYNSINNVSSKITSTIDSGVALLGNGSPYGGTLCSSYPNDVGTDGHWITVYGYKDYGRTVCINDPAVGWSSSFPSGFPTMFNATINAFIGYTSYDGTHGIIY